MTQPELPTGTQVPVSVLVTFVHNPARAYYQKPGNSSLWPDDFGQDQLQRLQIYKPKWCTWNMNILLRMDDAVLLDDMKKIPLQNIIFSLRISMLQMQTEELFCLHARESLFHQTQNLNWNMKQYKKRIWNNKNKKPISETLERQNQTAEEKRHIPETSEILDETTEDNTDISKTCHRQGSTTEDNRKISHKEDRKETIQGQDPSHTQCSTMEDNTKISHREYRKEIAQGQDPFYRQGSTTKDKSMVSDREDEKETAHPLQGWVSQGQGSTTKDNRKIANREDRKQTDQGQVSHRQGSTAEYNRNISRREGQKATAQGQLSHRQGSSTRDRKIDIAQRRKWKET